MKFYNIYIVVIILIKVLNAGILPQERRIDWAPGLQGEFPDKSHKINVRDFEAKGDGVSDDTQAFLDAIKAIPAEEGEIFIPEGYNLRVFPTPFNPGTNIQYTLPEKMKVQIQIYTIQGRLLTTMFDSSQPAGTHTVLFQPESHVASGVYLITVKTKEAFLIKKAVFIK